MKRQLGKEADCCVNEMDFMWRKTAEEEPPLDILLEIRMYPNLTPILAVLTKAEGAMTYLWKTVPGDGEDIHIFSKDYIQEWRPAVVLENSVCAQCKIRMDVAQAERDRERVLGIVRRDRRPQMHEVRISSGFFFDMIWYRVKSFILCDNDRGYIRGDRLLLREYSCSRKEYLPCSIYAKIVSVYDDADLTGLSPGYCILNFSVKDMWETETARKYGLKEWEEEGCV